MFEFTKALASDCSKVPVIGLSRCREPRLGSLKIARALVREGEIEHDANIGRRMDENLLEDLLCLPLLAGSEVGITEFAPRGFAPRTPLRRKLEPMHRTVIVARTKRSITLFEWIGSGIRNLRG